MNVHAVVREALADLGVTLARDWAGAGEEVYFVYTDSRHPDDFSDDRPQTVITYLTLHLFCPDGYDPTELTAKTEKRLFKAGFTWPHYQ